MYILEITLHGKTRVRFGIAGDFVLHNKIGYKNTAVLRAMQTIIVQLIIDFDEQLNSMDECYRTSVKPLIFLLPFMILIIRRIGH